jgi:hypothetical protein
MTFSIGWSRKNELGKTERVEFDLVRQKATWRYRPARNEPRQEFDPTTDDWDALMEVVERHLKRGKVTHEDHEILQYLHKRSLEGLK